MLIPDDCGAIRDGNFFLNSFYKEGHIVDTDFNCPSLMGDKGTIVEIIQSIFPNGEITGNDRSIVMKDEEHGALYVTLYIAPTMVGIDSWSSTLVPIKHFELTQAIKALPKFVPVPKKPDGSFLVYDYYTDPLGRTRSKCRPMSTANMNAVREDMFPGVNVERLVESFLDSKENILIFVGKPGTGKTTFMKKVLQTMSLKQHGSRSLYTKDMDILKQPDFWASTLPESGAKFLVLDDLDKELTPRTEVKQNFIVNQLLSMSNGLFENSMKTIITTNLVDEGIDSAVLRPGRCFDVLNLPYLDAEYAKDLWINVDNRTQSEWVELFDISATQITQAQYMANLESLVDDNSKDYLSDHSISVRDRYAKAE